jgi:hypothetical protein
MATTGTSVKKAEATITTKTMTMIVLRLMSGLGESKGYLRVRFVCCLCLA